MVLSKDTDVLYTNLIEYLYSRFPQEDNYEICPITEILNNPNEKSSIVLDEDTITRLDKFSFCYDKSFIQDEQYKSVKEGVLLLPPFFVIQNKDPKSLIEVTSCRKPKQELEVILIVLPVMTQLRKLLLG